MLWGSKACFLFFFFSSRRRHTRCSRDWSSDVCSSDLGRAEAALQAMLTRKCRAQLLHDRIGAEAFDRLHRKAVALNRVGEAGARGLIIDQHGARATYAVLASEMGPRQAAMLAQEIGQMGARLDHRLDLPPVHAQRDWRHGASTCIRARVTTAVAMLCSTASSPLTACASA